MQSKILELLEPFSAKVSRVATANKCRGRKAVKVFSDKGGQ
jgi:hypothetical protein